MTALNYQKAFARLLTDQGLRENFFQGKTKNFPGIPLSESQIDNLMLLDAYMTAEFSSMLTATRLSMVLNALPFTKKLLPGDFIEKNFAGYEKEEPPLTAKGSPTLEEVKRFGRFVEKSPNVLNSVYPFLSDLSRYEVNLFILTNLPIADVENKSNNVEAGNFLSSTLQINDKIKILKFEYDVAKIHSELKAENVIKISKKETSLVFKSSKARVYVKSINQSVCALMELCDGRKTVAEICQLYVEKSAEAHFSAEITQENIIKILNRLIDLDFLVFVNKKILH